MKPISINEYLGIHNIWSKRLLGIAEFQKKRDLQQIENEYNQDKYAKLVSLDIDTIEGLKLKECEQAGLDPINGEMIIAFDDSLFKASVAEARNIYYGIIKTVLAKYTSEHICELGCGYGFNLSFLGKNTYGGEYSKNAVNLAQRMGLDVVEFNYYQSADYNFIKPKTTVFTTHSIEQVPDATVIIENLEKQKSKIDFVVHFEPTVVEERSSLLGIMRNKYMELNDYNRNLITVLKSRKDIDILELQVDVFGLMPLNVTNIIVWKFKK